MKLVTLLLVLGALAAQPGDEQGLARRLSSNDKPPLRVVQMNVRRRLTSSKPVAAGMSKLRKRMEVLNVTVQNDVVFHSLEMFIGSPPQRIVAQIDTGSSDALINTNTSRLCASKRQACVESGTYNANASSTYHYVNSLFNISYVDGSGAAGDYVEDDVRVLGRNISGVQMGIAYKSSTAQSVLGIGLRNNEAPNAHGQIDRYDNLPERMAKAQVTVSNSYSLWLNDVDADQGTILFGGVDAARFETPLVSLPIQKVNRNFSQFLVTLTGLSLDRHAIADGFAQAVLLDSGSTFTYPPDRLAAAIYGELAVRFPPGSSTPLVPCARGASPSANLTFRFSEPAAVDVPLAQLVMRPQLLGASPLSYRDGVPGCVLGILPSGDDSGVLGDSFLRSAYAVYDLENNTIALARTRFNASDSNIAEIRNSTIPGAVTARNPIRAIAGLPSAASSGGHGDGSTAPGLRAPVMVALAFVFASGLWFP